MRLVSNLKYLCLPYPEYFRPADGADTLCCWSTILECDLLCVPYFYLLPAFHAISCRHDNLLFFISNLIVTTKLKSCQHPCSSKQCYSCLEEHIPIKATNENTP